MTARDALDDKGRGTRRDVLPASTLVAAAECLSLRDKEAKQQRQRAEEELL